MVFRPLSLEGEKVSATRDAETGGQTSRLLVSDPAVADCRVGDAATLFSTAFGEGNDRGNLFCKTSVINWLHQ